MWVVWVWCGCGLDVVWVLIRNQDPGIDVQVVATKASLHFFDSTQISEAAGRQDSGSGSGSGSGAPPMSKRKRKREEHGDEVTRDKEGEKLPEEEMIESGCRCESGSGRVGSERVLAMHGAEVWTDEDEWAVSPTVVMIICLAEGSWYAGLAEDRRSDPAHRGE